MTGLELLAWIVGIFAALALLPHALRTLRDLRELVTDAWGWILDTPEVVGDWAAENGFRRCQHVDETYAARQDPGEDPHRKVRCSRRATSRTRNALFCDEHVEQHRTGDGLFSFPAHVYTLKHARPKDDDQ